MKLRVCLILLVAAILAVGCSSGGQTEELEPTAADTPSGDPNVITYREIESVSASTAMDVIRRLRPSWLRQRTSGDDAVVYVENLRRGGTNVLRNIAVEQLWELRYLDGSNATTRFGTGHRGGAILVTLRR